MKKLMLAAVAAASLSAFAGWEKVGTVQLANTAEITTAAVKVGEMTGNQMASAMAAGAIGNWSMIRFFGPMRQGQAMLFSLFLDAQKLAEAPAEAMESSEYAVLYPISLSKADFIKKHPGTVETNGVLVVKGGLDNEAEDEDDEEKTFVRFSPDGKWAAASDKLEQVDLALTDIPTAEKTLDGDLVRLRIGPKVMKSVTAAMAAAKEKEVDPNMFALIKSIAGVSAGVRITDQGIDFRGAIKAVAGTELAKSGLKPLGKEPLAFAGTNAVGATAVAADVSDQYAHVEEDWAVAVKALKDAGLDLAKVIALQSEKGGHRFVIDVAALIRLATDGKGGFGMADLSKLTGALQELQTVGKRPFKAQGPAYHYSIAFKEAVFSRSVQERFNATLPEAATKKPAIVNFFSLASIFKAVVPHAVAAGVPVAQQDAIKPMLAPLEKEALGGIAAMSWNEKGSYRFFMRVSADEIRYLGGVANAFMAVTMMNAMGQGCGGCCIEDDDEDDEDDDED